MASKDNKKGFMDFFLNHSKKFMITVSLLSVLVAVMVVGAVWYLSSGDIVATYGNKKVTKTEYDDAKAKCEGFYAYNKDEKSNKQCATSQVEDMILTKALESEAEKRGITVTDEEINKKYNDLVAAYENEEAYKQAIKNAYGWTPEYAKANQKTEILKEKLASSMLRDRDVYGVYIRYDWSTAEGEQKQKDEDLSKKVLEDNFYTLMKNGAKEDEILKKLEVLKSGANTWDTLSNNWVRYKGINAKNEKDRFEGREDWAAVASLKKVGEVTPVFRSSGGYYMIYRLEGLSSGSYNDWEDFKQSVVQKAKINLLSYRFDRTQKEASDKIKSLVSTGNKLFGVKEAKAHLLHCDTWWLGSAPKKYYACSDCVTGTHFNQPYGTFVDGSNPSLKLAGVQVTAQLTDNNEPGVVQPYGIAPGCKTKELGRTGAHTHPEPRTVTATSDSNGNISVGSKESYSLSCNARWHYDIEKSGYKNIAYRDRKLQSNGGDDPIDATLTSWSNKWETYYGAYQNENTDNDGTIYLKLHVHPQGELKEVSCDSATSDISAKGWTYDADGDGQSNRVRFHLYKSGDNPNLSDDDDWNWSPQNIIGPLYLANQEPGGHSFDVKVSSYDKTLCDPTKEECKLYAAGLDDFGGFIKHINLPHWENGVATWGVKFSCPSSPPSPSCTLTPNRQTIRQGESVNMSWSGDPAKTHFTLRAPGLSDIPISTSPISLMPPKTTTYTLYDNTGATTCSTQITVTPHQSGTENPVPPN